MKGVVGLQNLGLTCYGNAVLQCLRHIEKLPWILSTGRYNTLFQKSPSEKRAKQQEFIVSLADMIQKQEESEGGILRPAGFWQTLRASVKNSVYDQFIVTAPHDAHEFLMLMLETLHESTSMEVEMQIMKSPPTNEKEKRVILALESWKNEFTKQYSPFVDIFHGLLHVEIECQTCKHISHRWETFNTLKGVVPERDISNDMNPPDILSTLQNELAGEDIEGYHCDSCKPTHTIAHRRAAIWRLPQTLIICLKRFTYDGKKKHTKVTASLDLDVKSLFSEESPEKNAITNYSLRAIVDHHGGAGGGHYTAQCRDKISEKWYIYDDETPIETPAPRFGESTYILFYERKK